MAGEFADDFDAADFVDEDETIEAGVETDEVAAAADDENFEVFIFCEGIGVAEVAGFGDGS